jgi:hypothetical protein
MYISIGMGQARTRLVTVTGWPEVTLALTGARLFETVNLVTRQGTEEVVAIDVATQSR